MVYRYEYDENLKRTKTILERVYKSEIKHGVFEVSKSVDEIGKDAFACSYIEEVRLPNGILKIGDGAFRHSTLRLINFPEKLIEICPNAFEGTLLGINKEKIVLPKNLLVIGESAFRDTRLHKIIFEGSPYIGDYAFTNSALEKIDIPEDLIYIGERAFSHNNLTEINAPYEVIENSLMDREDSAFTYNSNIESGYYTDRAHYNKKIPKRKLKKITKNYWFF